MINHMIIIIHLVPIGRSAVILSKSFLWNIIIEMLTLSKQRNAYNLDYLNNRGAVELERILGGV